jgi:phage-related protein
VAGEGLTMVDTFTWPTQAGNNGTETGAVLESRFGDGYRMVAADGINPVSRSWPFSWTGHYEDVFAMRDFLRAHVGIPFYWTAPRDVPQLYTCKEWDVRDVGGPIYTITGTFEQFNAT